MASLNEVSTVPSGHRAWRTAAIAPVDRSGEVAGRLRPVLVRERGDRDSGQRAAFETVNRHRASDCGRLTHRAGERSRKFRSVVAVACGCGDDLRRADCNRQRGREADIAVEVGQVGRNGAEEDLSFAKTGGIGGVIGEELDTESGIGIAVKCAVNGGAAAGARYRSNNREIL